MNPHSVPVNPDLSIVNSNTAAIRSDPPMVQGGPPAVYRCSWPVNPGLVTVNPDPVMVKLVTVTVGPVHSHGQPERASTNEKRAASDAGSAAVHPVLLARVPGSND